MAVQADNPYFQHSAHRSNRDGVRPSCGDCHIPTTKTYTNVTSGAKDAFVELTHNFSDPKAWEALRIEVEPQVRAQMHDQDSMTRTQLRRRATKGVRPTPCCARVSPPASIAIPISCILRRRRAPRRSERGRRGRQAAHGPLRIASLLRYHFAASRFIWFAT